MSTMLKRIGLAFILAIFITACGSANNASQEAPDVQDIQPGDKSVIQAPQPAVQNSTLEERSI